MSAICELISTMFIDLNFSLHKLHEFHAIAVEKRGKKLQIQMLVRANGLKGWKKIVIYIQFMAEFFPKLSLFAFQLRTAISNMMLLLLAILSVCAVWVVDGNCCRKKKIVVKLLHSISEWNNKMHFKFSSLPTIHRMGFGWKM